MKVFVHKKGTEIDLSNQDIIGQGGEGAVYAKGSKAYKIYHDPRKMISVAKIQELNEINDPSVIKPIDVLVDSKGKIIGYSTKFIKNAWSLCQLFPISFRQRENLNQDKIFELVKNLQDHISNIHSAKILIVDLNELNFLVSKDFSEIFCIDVDSYQTEHYAAQAIMDSIRDWNATQWSELSDWFSFGILSFQMFVGIHPFKGKYHGNKKEFKIKLPTDSIDDSFAVTRRRMKSNISVFNKDVSVPSATLPFDYIPKNYRSWYEKLFINGERLCPPSPSNSTVLVIPVIKQQSTIDDSIEMKKIFEFNEDILSVWTDGSRIVTKTSKGFYIDSSFIEASDANRCAFSPKNGKIIVSENKNNLSLYSLSDRKHLNEIEIDIDETSAFSKNIYLKSSDRVFQVVLSDFSTQTVASLKEVASVLPYATQLFSGVIIQKLLGTTYVSLVDEFGSKQIAIDELNKCRIIDAKYERNVLMTIIERNGIYSRIIFRFDEYGDCSNKYDIRKIENIHNIGLNFTVLDTNVCICIDEEEKIEIFSNRKDSSNIKIIEDKNINSSLKLFSQNNMLMCVNKNSIYGLRLKK